MLKTVEFELRVICKECGTILDWEQCDVGEIELKPCPECIKNAKEENDA